MTRSTKTVCSAALRAILRSVQPAGIGPEEFCRCTGVDAAVLDEPWRRVSCVRFRRAVAIGVECSGPLPPLSEGGLGWIEDDLPLLAATWLQARTLRSALELFARSLPLIDESAAVDVREVLGGVEAELSARAVPDTVDVYWSIALLDALVALVRARDGAHTTELELDLRAVDVPPAAVAALKTHGLCVVRLGQRADIVRIYRTELDVPLAALHPLIGQIFRTWLDEQLDVLDRDASVTRRVEQHLRWTTSREATSLSRALARARADLHASDRTLRRRLAGAGTSFRAMFQHEKAIHARRLVEQTDLTMKEIAKRLGFADQSSFTRFYRGNLGAAPSAHRPGRARERPRRAGAEGCGGG